jgi:hypothetical protein
VAIETNIERCGGHEQCTKCPKPAEFILKTDNSRDPFPDGARELALCRNDLAKHLASNPGLMSQVLVSLLEQSL